MDSSQIELVKKVNKRLVERFGIPHRNKTLPDPVDMLIGTILSQNTNDRNSYKAYKNLKKKFPDWEALSRARRTTIENEIRVAGLVLQKSTAIKEFLKDVKTKHGSISLEYINNMPDEKILEELTSFNGIGIKTASCVLLFALDKNVCPVDTHVHRTVNRIGIINAKTPDKTFIKLNNNFPSKIAHRFHTNLIRLGREICKPKNPVCSVCPILDLCGFDEKNMNEAKPGKEISFMLLDNIGT